MVCFRQSIAGAGRLLLDELRLCAALGRGHAPKTSTQYTF